MQCRQRLATLSLSRAQHLSTLSEMVVHVLLASDRLKVADEEVIYLAEVNWLASDRLKWLHAHPPTEDGALALLRLVSIDRLN